MSLDQQTEVLSADVARFPRARLVVIKGPDKGLSVELEGRTVVVGTDETCQLKLTDSSVSRRHVEFSGGPGGYRLRDLRSTNGVFLEGVQVLEARLLDKVRFLIGRTEVRFEPERQEVQWPLSPHERFGDVAGKSLLMRRVFALLERAAPTDSPVVLEGENGTGKELLAQAVHLKSARREAPFVVADLAGSSEPLMESDLFGHDVSSARPTARPGAFEEAHGGTLYLNEVTDLTPGLQVRLLRTLEAKEVRRPGQGGTVPVDVRVIASTTQDLDALVREGRFREDLSFKLGVFRVRVPSLRERPEDVPGLVRLFEARSKAQPLSDELVDMLSRHDWPGNVRELRAVLERLAVMPDLGAQAVVRAMGKTFNPDSDESSGARLRAEVSQQLLALPYHEAKERVLESFEKTYLLEHLKAAGGVVTRAAQRAGLPRQSLHRMLRRLGIASSDE
jgi:DNA-binding NtrC family response regulator